MRQFLDDSRRDRSPSQGLSRRQFARAAAILASGAAALPFFNEFALAQGLSAGGPKIPDDAVRINANENPMGPCPEAIEAIVKFAPQGGRYGYNETFRFIDTLAAIEGLRKEQILPFAGSSDPLHRAVLAFTSPTKSFVVAETGYEAGERAAQFLGAKVVKVPLRKDGSHDVNAMAEADPDAGGLVLELRRDVVVYYSAPNDRAVAFRERFARWAAAPARARVVVSTRDTFAEMFDNDDALAYEPAATAAIVLTGGDEEAEAAALDACADAEIAIIVRDSQPAEPPVITDTTAM